MKTVSMRSGMGFWTALLLGSLAVACAGTAPPPAAAPSGVHRPELEYLEAVNRAGPPRDPQLLLLLMGAYSNANRQREGIEFFTERLADFGPRLAAGQKSLYLAATALLRAQHASAVSLIERIGWVNDTVAMLEEAKRLSNGGAVHHHGQLLHRRHLLP